MKSCVVVQESLHFRCLRQREPAFFEAEELLARVERPTAQIAIAGMIGIPFRRRAADADDTQGVADQIGDLLQTFETFHVSIHSNDLDQRQEFLVATRFEC